MGLPLLIFYSPHGLEALVFEKYMTRLGYPVHIAPTRENAFAMLEANPSAIPVIAADKLEQELTAIARDMRKRTAHPQVPIFVLNGDHPVNPDLPAVHIIPRQHRLQNAIQGITRATRSWVSRGAWG